MNKNRLKTSYFLPMIILGIMLAAPSFIAFEGFLSENSSGGPMDDILVPRIGGEDTADAGQRVVDYYLGVFLNDWELGFDYNESRDGLGFAQSYTVYGSGYKDFSRAPVDISGEATIIPILSPDTSYNLTISLINSANSSLYIEQMYIKEDLDDLIGAIINAVNRGVDVKIIVGSDGSDQEPLNSLKNAGVSIRVCKENASNDNYFNTMHNKGIIVDGKKVLIASVNWSPGSFFSNREAGVIIENDEVSAYYTDLFNFDWNVSVNYNPSEDFAPESASRALIETAPNPAYSYSPKFDAPIFSGKMNITCLAAPDNVFDRLEKLILNAKKSIYISVYTLSSPYLMEALIDRIENGIDVKLLLEKENVGSYERNYNRWTMKNLTEISHNGHYAEGKWAYSSTTDELNDPAFEYQHCKYAIIDNSTLVISSGNWGRSSCPKPKDYDGDGYANVDGNRDWWVVIYGNGVSAPYFGESSDSVDNNEGIGDLLLYIIIGAAALAVSSLLYYIKRR